MHPQRITYLDPNDYIMPEESMPEKKKQPPKYTGVVQIASKETDEKKNVGRIHTKSGVSFVALWKFYSRKKPPVSA